VNDKAVSILADVDVFNTIIKYYSPINTLECFGFALLQWKRFSHIIRLLSAIVELLSLNIMSAEILPPIGKNFSSSTSVESGVSAVGATIPKETAKAKWKRRGYAALATLGTFAATEGAAHVGGTVSAATDTLGFIHDPKTLLGAVVLTYVPAVRGLGRLSQENNNRIRNMENRIQSGDPDPLAGETPLYAPAVLARKRMQKRIDKGKLLYKMATWHERIDPDKKGIVAIAKRKVANAVTTEKLLNGAGHMSFARPHGILEAYYGLYVGGATFLDNVQAGASFTMGANLAAAEWAKLQSDGAAHIRETGSREGIVKGVYEMRKERLKARARTIYTSRALSLASQVHI
jgi:hypothetical protein